MNEWVLPSLFIIYMRTVIRHVEQHEKHELFAIRLLHSENIQIKPETYVIQKELKQCPEKSEKHMET